VVPVRRGNAARTAKPNSRSDPGPSKPRSTSGKRAAPPSDSEIEEVHRHVVQDPSEVGQTGRTAPSHTEPPHVNGKKTVKGKRKATAAPSKAARQPPSHEPIEILEEESDFEEVAEPEVSQPSKQKKTQPSITRMGKGDESRLREQLRRVRLPVFFWVLPIECSSRQRPRSSHYRGNLKSCSRSARQNLRSC